MSIHTNYFTLMAFMGILYTWQNLKSYRGMSATRLLLHMRSQNTSEYLLLNNLIAQMTQGFFGSSLR